MGGTTQNLNVIEKLLADAALTTEPGAYPDRDSELSADEAVAAFQRALAASAPNTVGQVKDEESSADTAVIELYRQHFRSLAKLTIILTGQADMAEGIVQRSFMALHRAWPRLPDKSTDTTLFYLRRSVIRRTRSELRRQVGRSEIRRPGNDWRKVRNAGVELNRSAAIQTLRDLPPRQREALVLRYYLDLSEAQIATTLGMSERAVKAHTARAMHSLRATLEAEPVATEETGGSSFAARTEWPSSRQPEIVLNINWLRRLIVPKSAFETLTAPRGASLAEAWRELEREIGQYYKELGPPPPELKSGDRNG